MKAIRTVDLRVPFERSIGIWAARQDIEEETRAKYEAKFKAMAEKGIEFDKCDCEEADTLRSKA